MRASTCDPLYMPGSVSLSRDTPALRDEYPPEDRYPVRNVAVLCVADFATFGSELAVVTMLPGFFADTWGLGPAAAGAAASGFAFMNLTARPAGGLLPGTLEQRSVVALLGAVAGDEVELGGSAVTVVAVEIAPER